MKLDHLRSLAVQAALLSTLLFVFAIACPAQAQEFGYDISNMDSAYQSGWRNWFSGTNSHVTAVINAPYSSGITGATLYINGTAVRGFTNVPPQQPPPSIRFDVNFDSTHFGDGSSIDVRIVADASNGAHLDVTQSAPAYNKAYVFGNTLPSLGGLGDLVRGVQAVQIMEGQFGNANHTFDPTSPASAVNQRKDAIMGRIPWATVFGAYTHGNPGVFWDSVANNPGAQGVSSFEVHSRVLTKASDQPPYNFVLIDSCSTGATDAMAIGFGVSTFGPPLTDRAFVGWPTVMRDSQPLNDWTDRMLSKLVAGETVTDAIRFASDPVMFSQPEDANGGTPAASRYGDPDFKLHGVYGGAGLQWFL